MCAALTDDPLPLRGTATPRAGAAPSAAGVNSMDEGGMAPGRSPGSRPLLNLPPFTGSTSASEADRGSGAPAGDDQEGGVDRVFTQRDHSPPPSMWYPQVSQVLAEVSAIVERQDVSVLLDAADLFVCPVRDGVAPSDDVEGATASAAQEGGWRQGGGRGDDGKEKGADGSPRSPVPDEADVRRLLDNEHLRMSHAPRADAALDSVHDVHGVTAAPARPRAGPAPSGSSADDVVIFSPELEPMARAVSGGASAGRSVADRGRPSARPQWRQGAQRDRSADSRWVAPLAAGGLRGRQGGSPADGGRAVRLSRQKDEHLPSPFALPAAIGDTHSMPSSPQGARVDREAELPDLPALSLSSGIDQVERYGPTTAAVASRIVRAHGLPTRHSFAIPRPPSARRPRLHASYYAGVPPGVVERLGAGSDGTTSYYRLVWPGHTLTSDDSSGTPIIQNLSLSAFLDVTVSPTNDGRDMVVTLALRTLNFAVDGQLIEQTSRGSVLGYYVDRVRIQASANDPTTLVLDSTWPRASGRSIEVQREAGTSTNVEYGVNAGVEGPSPVASVSATTGRGKNVSEISSLTRPNWMWSSAVVPSGCAQSSAARWTWDMSTWADGSLYANDAVSLRGDAWPLLHPELVGEASIAPKWHQVRSRWRVHRAAGGYGGGNGPNDHVWPGTQWHSHDDATKREVARGTGGAFGSPPYRPPSPFPHHVSLTLMMEPRVRLRRRGRRNLRRPFSFLNRTLVQEWPPRTDPADARAQFLLRVDLPREMADACAGGGTAAAGVPPRAVGRGSQRGGGGGGSSGE